MGQSQVAAPLADWETHQCSHGERIFHTDNPIEIQMAISNHVLDDIKVLRKQEYRHVYPTMDLDNDVLDEQSITLYTRNAAGDIDSTARLCTEGEHPLPQHEYLGEYHQQGQRLIEWGRFVIVSHERSRLKAYYRTVYTLATRLGFDAVIMLMKPRNISLHQSLMGLRIIKQDTGINYGGQVSLACVAWELKSTKPEFFQWVQK